MQEKKNPVLSFVVLLVIVGAAIGVLFLVFKPTTDNGSDNTPKTTTTPSVSVTTTATPTTSVTTTASVTATPKPTATTTVAPTNSGSKTVAPVNDAAVPSNWKAIENTSQGYTAYRPTGFYYRLFSPDMFVLGIDPNKIPEASEYMGMISMMRLSASNNFDKYLANLETGYTTYTRTIDGRSWTMVEGKTKATDMMASKYVILGKVTVGSKEFMAKLESTASNYGGYADEYETFITTVDFK